MRRLHDEHHGTTACNDADSRPTLRTGVRGISLTPPLDAQAGTEVQIGLLLYFPVKRPVFMQLRACHNVMLLPSAVYGGRALPSARVWWGTACYGVAQAAPA